MLVILLSVAGVLFWTEPKTQATCEKEAASYLLEVQLANPNSEVKIACVPIDSVFKSKTT